MKTKLIYAYCLVCACFTFSACNNFDWDTNHSATLTPITSVQGADNIAMVINYRDSLDKDGNVTNSGNVYRLEWDKVTTSDLSKIFYEVQMYASVNTEEPFYIYKTTGNKIDNFAELTEREWNVVAERAGIKQSTEGEIKWRVKASTGVNEVFSELKTMKISRPDGFAYFPTSLFATGTATIGGEELKTAQSFRKLQTKVGSGTSAYYNSNLGVYNVFTYLKDGEFYIVEKLADRAGIRRFSITSDNKLVEILGASEVVKSKPIANNQMHKIEINMKNQTAKIVAIGDVELWYSGLEAPLAKLSQEITEKPVWNAEAYLEFTGSSISRHKYKFRMQETDSSGTTSYVYWGYEESSSLNATAASLANYFYLYNVDDSLGNYCFKFEVGHDKENLRINLDLSSSGDYYTHKITAY